MAGLGHAYVPDQVSLV